MSTKLLTNPLILTNYHPMQTMKRFENIILKKKTEKTKKKTHCTLKKCTIWVF